MHTQILSLTTMHLLTPNKHNHKDRDRDRDRGGLILQPHRHQHQLHDHRDTQCSSEQKEERSITGHSQQQNPFHRIVMLSYRPILSYSRMGWMERHRIASIPFIDRLILVFPWMENIITIDPPFQFVFVLLNIPRVRGRIMRVQAKARARMLPLHPIVVPHTCFCNNASVIPLRKKILQIQPMPMHHLRKTM